MLRFPLFYSVADLLIEHYNMMSIMHRARLRALGELSFSEGMSVLHAPSLHLRAQGTTGHSAHNPPRPSMSSDPESAG